MFSGEVFVGTIATCCEKKIFDVNDYNSKETRAIQYNVSRPMQFNFWGSRLVHKLKTLRLFQISIN